MTESPQQPTVSIVIPTRDRSVDLRHTLETVIAQEYPEGCCEIIAVDDGSKDDTPEVVEQLESAARHSGKLLRRISSGGRGTNAAVNLGIESSAADVIITMGDDTGTPEGWLHRLIAGLIASGADAVSGPLRIPAPGPLLGKHRQEIAACVTEVTGPCYFEDGRIIPVAGNMAVWRRIFERGMFDESLVPPVEEVDWALRAGVHAEFVEDAWAWHCKGPECWSRKWVFRKVWKQGLVTGCWERDYLRWRLSKRLSMAGRALRTCARALVHAGVSRCWGGIVVALGEISRAIALLGLMDREGAALRQSPRQNTRVVAETEHERVLR
jgi:glycosyltransferase involved in cell wall biosynthesis